MQLALPSNEYVPSAQPRVGLVVVESQAKPGHDVVKREEPVDQERSYQLGMVCTRQRYQHCKFHLRTLLMARRRQRMGIESQQGKPKLVPSDEVQP